MAGRLFAAAAPFVLRIVVSIAPLIVSAAAGPIAPATGHLWLAGRSADRDAATR